MTLSRRAFLRRLAAAAAALTVGGMAADELLEVLEQPTTSFEWDELGAEPVWSSADGRKDAFYAYGTMYADLGVTHPKPFIRSWS